MASRPTGSAGAGPAGAARPSASKSTTGAPAPGARGGGRPGIEGDRARAQLERAQEGGGEADTVVQEERHALLGLDAEPAQPAGCAVRERGELTVRVRP